MEAFSRLTNVKKIAETMDAITPEQIQLKQDITNYYFCLQRGIIAPELQEITAMVESFETRIKLIKP